MLIAQPAEETISGARAMIEDGLYTRFPKPDYALAFHVAAEVPAGRIEVPPTIVASSADSVTILVRGVGTHGAYPHLGVDPVLVASQIVVSLQSMVGRDINPLEGAVISVGSIHGGVKSNIIPEQVELAADRARRQSGDPHPPARRHRPGRARHRAGARRAAGPAAGRHPLARPRPRRRRSTTRPRPRVVRDAIAAAMGADRLIEIAAVGHGRRGFRLFRHARHRRAEASISASAARRPSEVATAPGHHSPLFRIQPEPSVTAGVEAMVVAAEALMPRR